MHYEKGKRFHSPVPTLKSKKVAEKWQIIKYKINSYNLAQFFFGFRQVLVTSLTDKLLTKQSVQMKGLEDWHIWDIFLWKICHFF